MNAPTQKDLPREEEFVRSCIARVLGVPVLPHDDGSQSGMYDLKIQYGDRAAVPVEVTSDVDERAAATLNVLDSKYDGSWAASTLGRNWSLQTVISPNLKQLNQHAEPNLRVLEQAGFTEFDSSVVATRRVHSLFECSGKPDGVLVAGEQLLRLGVERGISSASHVGEASIYLLPTLGGGSWDGSAEHVVEWINEFVASPRCADNLRKLATAGADEGHLAVFAHMTGVPWPVWRALIDTPGTQVVPIGLPLCPYPITHLWLFPSPGGTTGLAYDPARGWYRFDTTASEAESDMTEVPQAAE